MSARDDLSLDLETVDAQRELMGAPAPLRVLSCGHERRTHRTDAAVCHRCGHVARQVMTAELMRAEAAAADRAVRFAEEMAANARVRAAAWRERAERASGGHDHE